MLSRIANVFTFLTFCLLTAIFGLGVVAIHDFNHPNPASGNSHIFMREFERHADFSLGDIEGRPVGYQIKYTVCGRPELNFFDAYNLGKVLKVGPRTFGYTETVGLSPIKIYHPISDDDARRLGLTERKVGEPFEWGTGTLHVCQIDLTGVWAASKNLLASL